MFISARAELSTPLPALFCGTEQAYALWVVISACWAGRSADDGRRVRLVAGEPAGQSQRRPTNSQIRPCQSMAAPSVD